MWQIRKEFADFALPLQKGWLYLNAVPPIKPFLNSYPISWLGTIGGIKVRIIQKDRETISVDDFEFVEFPERYAHLKPYIVEWIDEYFKELD